MTEKHDQISAHEVRIYEAVKASSGWMTAREIAVAADVADRTSRAHAAAFADRGVFEVAKVFGGYRYRIATDVPLAGADFISKIEAAKRILGA